MRLRSFASAVAALAVSLGTIFQNGSALPAEARSHVQLPTTSTSYNNVVSFGAVGNGIIDDSTAIQNAANNAAATGKGVYFPAGTYLHFSPITFTGIHVIGLGSSSQLVSNNASNCAVILSGNGVSIQNMVISTQGLTGNPYQFTTNNGTLTVINAQNWTVTSSTIVQGPNICGILILQSVTGTVSSNVFDGTGGVLDYGLVSINASNFTIASNLLQNEGTGLYCVAGSFIAIRSNMIGNVTYPTQAVGVDLEEVGASNITQNSIQMASVSTGSFGTNAAVFVAACDSISVTGNSTYCGVNAIIVSAIGPSGSVISQNTIRNCGGAGISVNNSSSSSIQIASNLFGECGLVDTSSSTSNAIIFISGTNADASGASTFVQNNSYQGHTNGLDYYVTCTFTSPNIPPANVTGNTQSQTILGNSI
jgi:hypothetical protein